MPIEGPTDTVYIPATGQIVQESTGAVIETVSGYIDATPLLAVALIITALAATLIRRNRKAV